MLKKLSFSNQNETEYKDNSPDWEFIEENADRFYDEIGDDHDCDIDYDCDYDDVDDHDYDIDYDCDNDVDDHDYDVDNDRYDKYYIPDENKWVIGREALINRFTERLIVAISNAKGYVKPDRNDENYLIIKCDDENGNEKGYWIGFCYDDSEEMIKAEAIFEDSEYLCDLPEDLPDDIDWYCELNDRFLSEFTDYGFTAESFKSTAGRYHTKIIGGFEVQIDAVDQWSEYISMTFDLIDRLNDLADMEDERPLFDICNGEPFFASDYGSTDDLERSASVTAETAVQAAAPAFTDCRSAAAADPASAPTCCRCCRCHCFQCGKSAK
ncbi:MAG: hypothetical protein HDT44_06800 [Ruminococcaceae bacterium]|nr:hypothetical protein [Oscillospiraceae bacterium]